MRKDRRCRVQAAARHCRRPLATPLRPRLRPRSMKAEQRTYGERRQVSPALERTQNRPDRAAGRTATSRRWRMRGTKRQVAAQPNRRRPSGRATARNRRRELRPGLRPEPRAARKMRPFACSLRSGRATPTRLFYCRGPLCHRVRQRPTAVKFYPAATANYRSNGARATRMTQRRQAKIDCEDCTIYLGKSGTCDITAYTLHQPQPMIK